MQLLEPHQYQPLACAAFEAEVRNLSSKLPGARFEHVGASAIAGAISKGDLDICVLVDPMQHQSTVSALEALGYRIKTDTLRMPELCMLQLPLDPFDVALQVVAQGSKFEFFMQFRDALNASPHLVQQYNQLKRDSAAKGMQHYRQEKARFIALVLQAQLKRL